MSPNDKQSETSTVASFLADHPRMIGVLFTMMMLLTQTGQVVAGGGTYSGP